MALYRTALIGCGKIGSQYADDPLIQGVYTHAGAYAAHPQTECVAVCDRDEDKAQACAVKWKVPKFYTDSAVLLQESQPEVVSICVPNAAHGEVLSQVLRTPSVRAVLMEKPLALDIAQAKSLVQLAQERGIALAVNYSRRYSKAHEAVREKVRSGLLGKIQSISGYYTKGLFHNGTHWIDLARWILGEVRSVHGFHLRNRQDGDAQLDAQIVFENGTGAFLRALDPQAFTLFEMDILGTEGRICLLDSGHRIETFSVVDSPYYSGYRALQKTGEEQGDLNNVLLHAVSDLVDCLDRGTSPRCTGRDGWLALRTAAALMASAEQGRGLDLKEFP